jgi:rhamnulokinase
MELLIEEAVEVTSAARVFDAGDHRFVGASNMLAEVLEATGLPSDTPRAVVVRSILESIVAGVVRVIDDLGRVTGKRPDRAILVGGAARNPLIEQMLAEMAGLDVTVGSAEATALGNAIVQGVALGAFADIDEGRSWLVSGTA